MGIIRTDLWLQEDLNSPVKICRKLLPYFESTSETNIYSQLTAFGMYRTSGGVKKTLHFMEEQKSWDKVSEYFKKYKKKWGGPDIPIFIFPLDQPRGFFIRERKNKGGVSYPDKMFLFLSEIEDEKELEALFVHEYHHICRLNSSKNNINDYSLLDSMVMEGLAEYAVFKNCGKKYLAEWCSLYSNQEIRKWWEQFLVKNLDMKKKEKAHDQFLYGGGRIPRLLGYSAGFAIVDHYYRDKIYAAKESFTVSSSEFVENNLNFSKKSL